jgi:hypothetical protein
MKGLLLSMLLFASPESEGVGMIPASDVVIAGVAIGDSPAQVKAKLGAPNATEDTQDYLSLHYHYPHVRVSFSGDVVAGLFTSSERGCTPKGLCPGDSLEKMRRLYGEPLKTDRETGRFYEYYGTELYCWFQIPDQGGKVLSITVACQP